MISDSESLGILKLLADHHRPCVGGITTTRLKLCVAEFVRIRRSEVSRLLRLVEYFPVAAYGFARAAESEIEISYFLAFPSVHHRGKLGRVFRVAIGEKCRNSYEFRYGRGSAIVCQQNPQPRQVVVLRTQTGLCSVKAFCRSPLAP